MTCEVWFMYTKHVWNSDQWHNFNYVVNLPENYDESQTYPLVFFLHGAGERGDDLDVACAQVRAIIQAEKQRTTRYFPVVE